ncbi:hypothetical protein BOTBODRAFT_171136 [Botryobasidium botryosum FD-172 SS1]|uniref:CNH-domain-containing protein n=1 Tax=Botryobasidium botryosum (strain FD-172 SS1) TaxID=930990 RepID=A0A067MUA6_BOTB1|nr:hypothetical protein BOTBODRAFT_171136 [Botryobasidium botryosum FD-172 SS1]
MDRRTMEKPLGPRQPDKRSAAYESIFAGRPAAQAPQHQPPTPSSSQLQPAPAAHSHSLRSPSPVPSNAPSVYSSYNSSAQPYDNRRSSSYSSIAPSVASHSSSYYATGPRQPYPPPSPANHQGYYQQQPSQRYTPAVISTPYHQPAPHPASVYGHSAPQPATNGYSQNYVAVSHDPSLESRPYAGMTDAQAYQAEFYLASNSSQQHRSQYSVPSTSEVSTSTLYSRHSISVASSHRSSSLPVSARQQDGGVSRQPSMLSVQIEDGGLGLGDFALNRSTGTAQSIASNPPRTADMHPPPQYAYRTPTTMNSHPVARHNTYTSGESGSRSVLSPPIQPPRPPSLQVDTNFASNSTEFPVQSSPSPPLLSADVTSSSSSRRSIDSVRTMPQAPSTIRERVKASDRTRSLSASATTPQARAVLDNLMSGGSPSAPAGRNSPNPRRTLNVYPALLSRVAEAFRTRITLSEKVKDGLAYKDAFDGREAVDKIAYIIKTTDRNLALLLGRSLDAQKFFHDVTYDHRLRDSPNELYQFRTRLPSPFVSSDEIRDQTVSASVGAAFLSNGTQRSLSDMSSPRASSVSVSTSHSVRSSFATDASTIRPDHSSSGRNTPSHQRPRAASVSEHDVPLPTGVFTLLTDCYSPTCSRDMLCYSIACPRRLEQQARLNIKPQPGLKRSVSRESLGDFIEPGTLWVHSVPQEVVDSVSETEKKRQEAINEVIYTERDFVRDMEYLQNVWIKSLQTSDVIPESRRNDFIVQVFWNIHEIVAVNTRLRDALNKRQKSYAVVETIGDILIEHVPNFSPFLKYGSHQLYGKYEFEKEKGSNPAFAQFVEDTERLPESRKLELNGYLTKPTTRLARYPLLLEVVLKHTPADNPDKVTLPKVIAMVKDFLQKVNIESGKTENRFNLLQLDQQLVFRSGEYVDLRLTDENRELVYKGMLKRRGGNQNENGDLQIFLFDHALLMVKAKNKQEQYKVFRKPIPLELLVATAQEEPASTVRTVPPNRPKTSVTKRNSLNKNPGAPLPMPRSDNKHGFAITFTHLGRKGYTMTLWANTHVARRKWLENIAKQQELMRERSTIFETVTLNEGFFSGVNKVNCAAPFSDGKKIAYGCDDGVYFSELSENNRDPFKVLALPDVTQVDILEVYQLMIVLSERSVLTFPLDSLDPMDPTAGLKRARRVASHTSFFKAGTCLGRMLVCIVKASALSSTIKTLEPIDQSYRTKHKPTIKKFLQGGNETLRIFKEFYIPTESSSIHFLKTKLCVGCTKGFEIVDLETLDTQGLLDPADTSLDFVQRRENIRPVAIYRIESEFLLCYDEFAFFVNKSGWRARPGWIVYWEGTPTTFALHYPYVLAIDQTFIEVRHVDSGQLVQVLAGRNLRCLFADTPPSAMNTSHGYGSQFSPYSPRASPEYGRSSFGSMMPRSHARDEILLASDDRVLAVRLAAGGASPTLDSSSSSRDSATTLVS